MIQILSDGQDSKARRYKNYPFSLAQLREDPRRVHGVQAAKQTCWLGTESRAASAHSQCQGINVAHWAKYGIMQRFWSDQSRAVGLIMNCPDKELAVWATAVPCLSIKSAFVGVSGFGGKATPSDSKLCCCLFR